MGHLPHPGLTIHVQNHCNKYPLFVVRIKGLIELVYTIAHDKCPIYMNDLTKPKKIPINLRSENDIIFHNIKLLHMVDTLLYIMHHNIGKRCQM